MTTFVVDTGPLVAFLDRRDEFHAWSVERFAELPVLVTCEAVLVEVCHILRRIEGGSVAALELLDSGAVTLGFQLEGHSRRLGRLMRRYADAPMSLADACLVRMGELIADSKIVTLDAHFRFYRRHGRQVLPLVIPDSR